MAKWIRGMELVRQPVIIFVTGYEKYVYDDFAAAYLRFMQWGE